MKLLIFLTIMFLTGNCDENVFTGFYILPIPKGCKINEHHFNVGEVYEIPGNCTIATCILDNKFNKSSCPKFEVDDPENYIRIDGDLKKPYPECCANYKKNDKNSLN